MRGRSPWLAVLGAACALGGGGCNLLIDADEFRGRPGDGGADAAADAMADAAAPPGPLEPSAVWEGEGAGDGARPVVLVLRGEPGRFEAGTAVRIGEVDADLVEGEPLVSADGATLAVAIRVPVDEERGEGEDRQVPVVLVPPGGEEETFEELEVRGLDEADLSGTVEVADLRARYAKVVVSGALVLRGAAPARIAATADIEVLAGIDAGGSGSATPGPGGCAGGGAGQPGGCQVGGGGAGAVSGTAGTGGGGGGHATLGTSGAGGASGGQPTGTATLVPLAGERGHGGGGGGNGTVGQGGAGGAGGGVVELAAGGTISIEDLVSVRGAAGGEGGGGGLPATAGGSGGGGSGGGLLVRASAVTGAGMLNATGGPGGTSGNDGGAGADGRIRIDTAEDSLPELAAAPAAVRGPRWAADTPWLVADAGQTLTLFGEPLTSVAVSVRGGAPAPISTDNGGVATVEVELEPGENRLCALVSDEVNPDLPEAGHCVTIVVVP